jgi:hypothetical protein|tara:strand:+ start:1473 stop:1694 length:222 start_codon:yes stop_codon:yes gene_type:complete
MKDEEWNYQDEEFDDSLPYIELQFGPEDLYHVYECVKYRYEQWPGGHPDEQERLEYLKNFLYRVVLEYKFKMQ